MLATAGSLTPHVSVAVLVGLFEASSTTALNAWVPNCTTDADVGVTVTPDGAGQENDGEPLFRGLGGVPVTKSAVGFGV